MARFVRCVAEFYSEDGGEWWVSEPYAGRYRVFGPWTSDALFSSKSKDEAIAHAKMLSEVKI